MYGPGSLNLRRRPFAPSRTSSTRRDSRPIAVKSAGIPDRARSARIISPAEPPARPAAMTSWPNVCSTRATATPRPAAW